MVYFSFMARAQLHWYFHDSVSDEKKQMVANVEKQLEEARELVRCGLSCVNCKFLGENDKIVSG